MSTVVALFYFPFVSRDCVRRFESQPINVDAFIAVHFCGRYGYFFWPIWSFRVADVVVADMVCGRYGCGRYGLWPMWYRPLHFNYGRIFSRFDTIHERDGQTTHNGMDRAYA